MFFESKVNVHNYLHSIIQKGAKNTINIKPNILIKISISPVNKEEQARLDNF